MNKKTLLRDMQIHWQRLVSAVEGVPHDRLEHAILADGRSIKAACAVLTAWDGETMRRIRFATGERTEPPHDPLDDDYWHAWADRQIEVKSVMPVRGVMIDMIGTRRRLLELIESLDESQFERWLATDPHAGASRFAETATLVEQWRETWNTTQPSAGKKLLGGLKKLLGGD